MIDRLDVALWQLPVWARKVVVFPFAVWLALADFVIEGWGHAAPAARNQWRHSMKHVETPPTERKLAPE